MKKILALGASNSKKSINKALAIYAANKVENVEVIAADLNDYELPLYSPELEMNEGIPENAKAFLALIQSVDGIVLSMAEHNGLPTAAFKNLWDWSSRLEKKMWQNKPLFLLATSPGARGGANVLRVTKEMMPHFGGNIVATFSLPEFYKNVKDGHLINIELENQLIQQCRVFQESL